MKIETIDIERVIPYARNPRKNAGAVDKVAASLREFGFRQPIVVDKNYTVVVGHTRLLAAKKLGMTEIPVHVAEGLTDAQIKAYRIADNRTNEEAEWDIDLLKVEFKELQGQGAGLSITAFDEDELNKFLFEPVDGLTNADETPKAPINAKSKLGDIWICDKHRVMCGDSTNINDVEKLMNGIKADLCFTSPPYALGGSVSLSGNKAMSKKGNAYDEHDDNIRDWISLMQDWFSTSFSFVSSAWVVNLQPLAENKRYLMKWIHENSSRLVDIVTWDKGHAAPQIARGVMASRYEWMIVFSSEEGASRSIPLSSWQGTIQSVYAAPPQRNNEFSSLHAATMPIHVPIWVLQNLCNLTRSVFDPFSGTGTTLIASEKLNKNFFGMEISPQYCDVIVKRWQDFTGKDAVLESNGKKFNEIN